VSAVVAVVGAHMLLYTPQPDAVRAVLRDALGWEHVDAHEGWLIFALPPAELGVHPGDAPKHEICLMCDDIQVTVAELRGKGVDFRGEPADDDFGVWITMLLPGGVELLLYEPKHATPLSV
jgi:catechol 2,3-dioxygenase-like lactoylglutathione lyase family enzyme